MPTPDIAETADDRGWSGYVADGYARLEGGEIAAEYHRLVAPFLDRAPRRVIDVGTGPGHFLVALRAEAPGAELLGIDVDARHVEMARRDLDRRGVRATLQQASGDLIPAPDGHFDVAISQAVMPYSKSDRGFLRELWRVLRPGGILWFATHGLGFYAARVVDRATYWKLRYSASVLSGLVSMTTGYKPLADTPVTVRWLTRTVEATGFVVNATEWSEYGGLPKLIRISATKRAEAAQSPPL